MKKIYLFLLTVLLIVSWNTRTNNTTSDIVKADDIIRYGKDIIDTLIPKTEVDKIISDLRDLNLSNAEKKYINLSLEKSLQIDEETRQAFKISDSIFNTKKTILRQLNPDSTTITSLYNSYAASEFALANEYVKNFQQTDNPVRNALQPTPGSDEYLKCVYFDVHNGALQQFADLSRRSVINGIRVYIGKETNNPRSHDYKLILIGTKNDTDVFNTALGPQVSIQNYGQPCKPVCFGGERLPQ